MKCKYTYWFLSAMILALAIGLTACEEEDSESTQQLSSSSEILTQENSQSDALSDTPTQASVAGNDSDSTHDIWVTISIVSNSVFDTNFSLASFPTTNAALFLQEDGTYSANGNVFTNCDDLGDYFLSQPISNIVQITNCGTEIFP